MHLMDFPNERGVGSDVFTYSCVCLCVCVCVNSVHGDTITLTSHGYNLCYTFHLWETNDAIGQLLPILSTSAFFSLDNEQAFFTATHVMLRYGHAMTCKVEL